MEHDGTYFRWLATKSGYLPAASCHKDHKDWDGPEKSWLSLEWLSLVGLVGFVTSTGALKQNEYQRIISRANRVHLWSFMCIWKIYEDSKCLQIQSRLKRHMPHIPSGQPAQTPLVRWWSAIFAAHHYVRNCSSWASSQQSTKAETTGQVIHHGIAWQPWHWCKCIKMYLIRIPWH
jgi:hypothetical protein